MRDLALRINDARFQTKCVRNTANTIGEPKIAAAADRLARDLGELIDLIEFTIAERKKGRA